MENENVNTETGTPEETPIVVELDETPIQELIDLIIEDREIEKEEKELEKAEEEKLQEEVLQDEEITSGYQENLLLLQEGENETSSLMLLELQTLNENIILQNEKIDSLTDITVESGFMVVLSIAVAFSIKVFVDQVSKW